MLIRQQSVDFDSDTLPKTGLFYVLLTSKEGNIAFLPHPLRAMLCPCSSYLYNKQNNKHPNFEWRGQVRGADSFILRSYPS